MHFALPNTENIKMNCTALWVLAANPGSHIIPFFVPTNVFELISIEIIDYKLWIENGLGYPTKNNISNFGYEPARLYYSGISS